mmetsp:Transcript_90722/g.143406  ORF Transcript_90722/g.143406 Transcript_90722/m.143406 type:complete len:143 (-) Transcript_90722:42-470(-)
MVGAPHFSTAAIHRAAWPSSSAMWTWRCIQSHRVSICPSSGFSRVMWFAWHQFLAAMSVVIGTVQKISSLISMSRVWNDGARCMLFYTEGLTAHALLPHLGRPTGTRRRNDTVDKARMLEFDTVNKMLLQRILLPFDQFFSA